MMARHTSSAIIFLGNLPMQEKQEGQLQNDPEQTEGERLTEAVERKKGGSRGDANDECAL